MAKKEGLREGTMVRSAFPAGDERPTTPPKAQAPMESAPSGRGLMVEKISSYFDNLKAELKGRRTLCVLLDTIRARVIDIIWSTEAE